MREVPALFLTEMVRAILDGRKTQTRRPVKPQPKHDIIEGLAHITIGMNPADDGALWYDADCVNPGREVRAPWRIGDTLWVRETWGFYGRDLGSGPSGGVQYRADLTHKVFTEYDDSTVVHEAFMTNWKKGRCNKWRPSILMPRWAAIRFLRVTDVRPQRLRDISTEDAIAEGFPGEVVNGKRVPWTPHGWFWAQWEEIYRKKESLRFDANPYMWATTFEVIK